MTWLRGFGRLVRVGIEGTGSYGAGLQRSLQQAGVEVREVLRPKRQVRRRRGKSDPVDAEAAARTVIADEDLGTPKRQDGSVEAIRVLRLTRRSALKARTQAANQLHAIIQTAPGPLREQLRSLRLPEMIQRVRRFRLAAPTTPLTAARFALRGLAERWTALDEELRHLDEQLSQLVHAVGAPLLAVRGVGVDTAGALLVGHLTGISPSVHEWEAAPDGCASAGSGSAKWMTPSIGSLATSLAFASPFERRGIGVPGASGRLQPVDDLHGVGRRVTGQRAVGQDALDGFGHVQPRPAERCVQRHHAMFEQPHDEARGEVSFEVVHD